MAAGADNKPHPVRPALVTLQRDQSALFSTEHSRGVREGLRKGFSSRRSLIRWYQRAAVRTFGYLGDVFAPPELQRDRVLLAACITGIAGGKWCENPPAPAVAREYRNHLEARVQRACTRAYKDVREVAGEYGDIVQDGDVSISARDLDPDRQQHLAMRPAFQELDDKQNEALERYWGGFRDLEAVLDWVHDLKTPSNGEIADGLAGDIVQDQVARQCLLDEFDSETAAREWREAFLISEVLPAFLAGAETMTADELAAPTRPGSSGGSIS